MKAALWVFSLVLVTAFSCKKVVEDVKRNYVLDIMTKGEWMVESYVDANTDITSQFSGYLFKFKDDGTVTGTKSTTVQTGTWEGEVRTYSIISNFPDAGEPLVKLNGTWVLKDSSEDYVVAEMTINAGIAKLKLRKVQ